MITAMPPRSATESTVFVATATERATAMAVADGTPTEKAGLHDLVKGWDGYDAPPPSLQALYWADCVIWQASARGLYPSHVMACVDGGVSIHFSGRQSFTVELFNSGEFVIATSSGPRTAKVQELMQSGESVAIAVEQASVLLS